MSKALAAFYADPAAFKAALDKAGLAMPTGHFGLAQIEGERDKMLALARSLNMQAVIVPYVMPADRPTDAAGWVAFAARLAEAGKPFLDAGFAFGWHNHDFEFVPHQRRPHPAGNHRGAGRPVAGTRHRLGRAGRGRIRWRGSTALAPRSSRPISRTSPPRAKTPTRDGWADVGHGTLDWAPIKAALDAVGCTRRVVEHDNPKDDKRFASRSLATVKGW